MSQLTTYFGFSVDIFELDFAIHTEHMIVQAQDDHKTAQLRAAGFIGEDYDGTGPKPNTLYNSIDSSQDYKRLFAITEPDQVPAF